MNLYTIGHSNRSIDELLALLQAHGIKQAVDVRMAAGSSANPQFMKRELDRALEAHGIRYTHFPALGGFRKPRPTQTLTTGSKFWMSSREPPCPSPKPL